MHVGFDPIHSVYMYARVCCSIRGKLYNCLTVSRATKHVHEDSPIALFAPLLLNSAP